MGPIYFPSNRTLLVIAVLAMIGIVAVCIGAWWLFSHIDISWVNR